MPSFYIASGIVVVLCCRYCLEWALGIIRAAAMQMNRILMQCETTYKLRRERLIAFLINCCIVKVSLRTRSNIPTKMDFYFLLSTTARKLLLLQFVSAESSNCAYLQIATEMTQLITKCAAIFTWAEHDDLAATVFISMLEILALVNVCCQHTGLQWQLAARQGLIQFVKPRDSRCSMQSLSSLYRI